MQTGEDRRELALAGAGVEVRRDTDAEVEQPRFRGHAAVFDSRTAIGDPFTWGFYEEIVPGAFSDTLTRDDQRFLLDHNPYYVVSRVSAGSLSLAQDARGLAVDSALDSRLSYVSDLIVNVENRNVSGMSFGFFATSDEWSTIKERDAAGQLCSVELRRVRAAKVPEVSAVTFPAYEASDAGLRAADPVRAVGLALRERPDAAAEFEARSRHCPELARYFERDRITLARPTSEPGQPSDDRADESKAEHQPPKAVQDNAQKALDAIDEGKGGDNLTETGKARARQLASGDKVSLKVVREMNAYFARHDKSDGGKQHEKDTPAWVAWNAWGGDAGWTWAKKVIKAEDGDDGESDQRSGLRQPVFGVPSSVNWYRIQQRDDDPPPPEPTTTEVFLYDVIGGFWGPCTEDFVRDLAAITTDTITVRINSPGGSVFDGIAILNALRGHSARITTVIEGLAASAASFIAMAGDDVVIWRNAEMMIHDPLTIAIGNADDFRDLAERLDHIANNIASVYADRAGGDVADWRAAMAAETWYSAEEAVEAGLADEVRAPAPRQTEDPDETGEPSDRSFDLSPFRYAGRSEAPAPGSHERRFSVPTEADMVARRAKSLDARRLGG